MVEEGVEREMERTIKLLNIEEASRALGISPAEAWRYILDGRLTAIMIDGRCLVSELQLLCFMSN
jgi:hypothetical protein